jgi:hypothetical protein
MCFQAIACYHLGQFDRSRRRIENAARWIARADRQKLPSVDLTTPSWGNFGWDEHLEAQRLLDEAKALVSLGLSAAESTSKVEPSSRD